MIPLESTPNPLYTPLVNPSCLLALAAEAAVVCEIEGLPLESLRFQSKLRSLAPFGNPGNAIPLRVPVGDTSLPVESNVIVPVLLTAVPVKSPGGRDTL